ncbi:DNA cytosine methyltransferase [Xanthomonas fragariae]|uniref:DNA cytosine methyltransferase n=1 Tax=Xanthomonas fragariae TaxID=48664 RepID=UPI0022AB45E0|nr:DNA (cytosine-5-)-methyltransferase [Xanthomonas fragariae]WAT15328.1 DNA (cytosine-5-)-methyltransferase [Xanthomonas fragariae]
MPTAVSLFSGCGGSDAGLVAAGFDVLMANDILRYAADVYRANLPDTDYKVAHIETVKSFPSADLLVGCYPCQGYSQGGARESSRDINYLFKEFGRALRSIRPKAFIVENVSGLIRKDNIALFNWQIRNFRSAGYRVKWKLMNAAEYGVAQERRRIIIVGLKSSIDSVFEFPAASHGPNAKKPFKTIKQALNGLPDWPVGEFNEEPFHWYYLSRNRRRGWDEISKTIVSRDRHIPLHPISPELRPLGPDKFEFVSNDPARRFSYREAARLQGFRDGFKFPDSFGMSSRYKVVGNAVPPPLFEAVARSLPPL